jgi:hypothetical protein
MAKPYTSPDLVDAQGRLRFKVVSAGNGDSAIGRGLRSGRVERPRDAKEGYCGPVYAATNLKSLDECIEIIKEREAKGTTNRAILAKKGFFAAFQYDSDECWSYSRTMAKEGQICLAGGKFVRLSAVAIGFRLYGQDQGGWSGEAAKAAKKFGDNTDKEYPHDEHSFTGRYDTQKNRELALSRQAIEYYDLPIRGLSEKQRLLIQLNALLDLGPMAYGNDRMRHACTHCDPVLIRDRVKWYDFNSGLYRNSKGITIFDDDLGVYNDAVVPTVEEVW